MTIMRRRTMLAGPALLPLVMVTEARADTTDLALICDLTLGAPLRRVSSAFRATQGVRVHVFPTAPGLIVPQLTREVQIDIVMTRNSALDEAAQAGLLAAAPRTGNWRNTLVVAEMADATGPAETGKFAVSELPSASGVDGAAIVAQIGIDPARIVSTIDTTEVAFLLTTGVARTGLLYLTDVRADPRLRVVSAIKDQPLALWAAAITKGARRPDPAAFIAFLNAAGTRDLLSTAGLEVAA